MASTLSDAISQGILSTSDDAVVFYDLDRLSLILGALASAFPPNARHAIAVKANPIGAILRRIAEAGFGAEVASVGELELAHASGFSPNQIVFDSPAKTAMELAQALREGIAINANSLAEIDRIGGLWSRHSRTLSQIGLRINPMVGPGLIEGTSTSMRHSKFGVPIPDQVELISKQIERNTWITGLHVHIGSQGMHLKQLVEGVVVAYELFMSLRAKSGLVRFNLGGGLPVAYRATDKPPTFRDYAEAVHAKCPGLFDDGTVVATEFGRAVHANSGWVASRIEYIIDTGDGIPTLVVHVGADMFLREAYHPNEWHHDMSVTDSVGTLRTKEVRPYRVAGPLCFAGDYLARHVELPMDLVEGDFLLIHDAGAYTFSMWSLYNSRLFPSTFGYEGTGRTNFTRLLAKQQQDNLARFWMNDR